jgi:hypothetical protein
MMSLPASTGAKSGWAIQLLSSPLVEASESHHHWPNWKARDPNPILLSPPDTFAVSVQFFPRFLCRTHGQKSLWYKARGISRINLR